MNNIISYIIELNITLTAFFLIYIVIFKRDSNFNLRRMFLFLGMIISISFPLMHITVGGSGTGTNTVVYSLDELIVSAGAGTASAGSSLSIFKVLMVIYSVISLLFFSRLLFMLTRVIFQATISKKETMSGTTIWVNEKLHASSFFNLIFIDPEQMNESNRQHILQHEKSHVKLLHSIDRIFAEFLLSLSWINPVAWMFRQSVITNQEYQADNNVITIGTDKVSYQMSILNQYIGSASISNQFSSQIKNRIIMLNKNYKKGSFLKSLLVIPAAAILFFFIACNNEGSNGDLNAENNIPAEEQIFYVVEEMPTWQDGGDLALAMRKFISANLVYPQEAIDNTVQGKVFVHFIVTKTGNIEIPDPSQLPPEETKEGKIGEVVVVSYRPINEEEPAADEKYIQLLKDEAVRVISEVPDVVPGKQRGKNVNVIYTMPINFTLK